MFIGRNHWLTNAILILRGPLERWYKTQNSDLPPQSIDIARQASEHFNKIANEAETLWEQLNSSEQLTVKYIVPVIKGWINELSSVIEELRLIDDILSSHMNIPEDRLLFARWFLEGV